MKFVDKAKRKHGDTTNTSAHSNCVSFVKVNSFVG